MVGETMKIVMDDKAIEAIVSMLMDLQDRDNVNVPLYEQQLREADTAISNLLGAIQQGILTRSTKARLEELENRRDELENRLACEKLAKPKVSAEFMTFWLHRFRKLDVRQKGHRKMLIDTFINAIFLYDDKMVITFNYKEGTKTITFAELQEAISNKNGSDLDCLAAPYRVFLRHVKGCENTRFLYSGFTGGAVDNCAFSFIYGHFRDRQGQRRMLNKRSLGRLEQRKTGFYYPVDKTDHFLLAVLVIALHNDMHQTV